MKNLQQCVDKGVVLLDKEYPDWWKKIDCKHLDMGTHDMCILGQLYGKFYLGVKKLMGVRQFASAEACGFSFSEWGEEFALEDLWKKVINKRKEVICGNQRRRKE